LSNLQERFNELKSSLIDFPFIFGLAEALQLRQLLEKHGIPFEPVEKALQVRFGLQTNK
jgi:hypothetical protein